jgi:hypothetical protein
VVEEFIVTTEVIRCIFLNDPRLSFKFRLYVFAMEVLDIYKEIGTSAWQDRFGFECKATRDFFRNTMTHFTTHAQTLREFQGKLRKYSSIEDKATVNTFFSRCAEVESKLEDFQNDAKAWENEGKSQIVFTSEWAKPFNQIPYLLPAAAIFKLYIVPFFAVLLPLLAWILPFVIVRVFFNIPMPFETYIQMMLNMWLGGKTWTQMDLWAQARVVFQTGWTAFGLFQGIYQPIQQALHAKEIDKEIVKQGLLLQEFIQTVKGLFAFFEPHTRIGCYSLNEIPLEEPRQTYAYIREHPNDLRWIWQKVAELEMCWRLAHCPDVCYVEFMNTKKPYLMIEDFYDASIQSKEQKLSSCSFEGNAIHGLITGPNKGGKSSTLRAMCLNVWLAQTVGLAFAGTMRLTPFSWIRSGLRLADTPGEESLFEREILFATKTIQYAQSSKTGRGLVIYDECFHSTNPPDGEKTARHFLRELWLSKTVVSVVSTHVFSLVDTAPSSIQRLCVPAIETENGIEYTYTLSPGICKVSSVEELYKKYGFAQVRSNKKANLSALNRKPHERSK